ncbi:MULTISPECIES: hypothetical protein [Bacillus cereus group]|uniref:hypothetical protein n=1 Tax=Bacillus cereus group TaxID=86661 RepID=UPI0020B6F85C|nr:MULTISPECIES: hypothetical protein [Bacillus cereus group]MDA1780820.1 hypothetical protein [Bacillus cereus group sp. BY9-3LC]MDD9282113.1 hypothetical protein [Bacillus thuringiensis]UTG83303.1 hypothetical protein MON10_01510 [Bacillus paranthracis]
MGEVLIKMFEEEFENLSDEEQRELIEYLDEYMESVAIGGGDYYIGDNGEIVIED